MSILVIPTIPGRPYYTARTKMDGREYTLRFAWNERAERWSLDILDADEVPLVCSIRLVSNWPLLRYYQWDTRLPPGELMVVDLSLEKTPPGLYELGIGLRCELTYYATT